MSDDRFEDLGGERRRAEIGDELAERDRTHPEEPPRRPEVPRPGNKYAWAVGIVALMGLGILLFFQTLPNEGKGFEGPRRGSIVQAFAAPLGARAPGGRRQRLPAHGHCPEQAGSAAGLRRCAARRCVNVCELRRRPLVLTFIFDRGADCYPQVDRTERVRRDLPGVNFATVFFTHKERDQVRALVQERALAPAGRRSTPTARWPTCTASAAARRRCSRARAGGWRRRKLGNLTEDSCAAGERRIARLMELELDRGLGRGRAGRGVPRAGAGARAARGAPAQEPAEVKRAPARARRPLHRRQGDPHAPGRRAVGLPGLLPPGRDRPRHRPHAGGADRAWSACATAACASENLVDDALTIAIAETGVPVFALDADKVEGELGLRLARAGERLAGVRPLSARQIVVADEARPVAMVLGEVGRRRRRHLGHASA